MNSYSQSYLNDVVYNQGKLFDYVAYVFPNADTSDFINAYMKSKTRESIDKSQAYVNTMDAKELFDYFVSNEKYNLKKGNSLKGFLPEWIGEFYAYYQWFYNIPSRELINKVSLEFLEKAYPVLHDLDLESAVIKAGKI